MKEIYRITIHGRVLESRDLRILLARAVSEKREMDRRMRVFAGLRSSLISNRSLIPAITPVMRSLEQAG
jgi:hypothetical protein